MINVNKLNKILYNDYGIILNESETAYLKYLNNTSDKDTTGILKEFFTKCTTRHLCVENNKKDLNNISIKILNEGTRSPSSPDSIHGDIYGTGVVNTEKFLRRKEILDLEEITDTVQGQEGIIIDDGEVKKTKYFNTKEEADRYRKEITNKALTQIK